MLLVWLSNELGRPIVNNRLTILAIPISYFIHNWILIISLFNLIPIIILAILASHKPPRLLIPLELWLFIVVFTSIVLPVLLLIGIVGIIVVVVVVVMLFTVVVWDLGRGWSHLVRLHVVFIIIGLSDFDFGLGLSLCPSCIHWWLLIVLLWVLLSSHCEDFCYLWIISILTRLIVVHGSWGHLMIIHFNYKRDKTDYNNIYKTVFITFKDNCNNLNSLIY